MLRPSSRSNIADSQVISDEPVAIIMSAARSVSPQMHEAFPNAHVITDGDPAVVGRVTGSDIVHPGTQVSGMQAFSAVLKAARAAKVRAVITPFETGLPAGAFVRTLLGLPGTGMEAAIRSTNKYVMKQCFSAAGIRTANFVRVENQQQLTLARQRLNDEVVIKPLFGGGSAGVTRLVPGIPAEEIEFPILCEQALRVEAEFHMDGVINDGTVMFAVASQYGEPMLSSAKAMRTYSSRILDQGSDIAQACLRLSEEAVEAVRLRTGVFHAEALLTTDGLYLGEIACRPAGGGIPLALELSSGINVTRYSWAADCGHEAAVDIPSVVKNIWHVALPEGLTSTQRQRLSGIPGHLCTTTPLEVKSLIPPQKETQLDVHKDPSQGVVQRETKKVFYSATNAGCTYFDVDLNQDAPTQVRILLEQSL